MSNDSTNPMTNDDICECGHFHRTMQNRLIQQCSDFDCNCQRFTPQRKEGDEKCTVQSVTESTAATTSQTAPAQVTQDASNPAEPKPQADAKAVDVLPCPFCGGDAEMDTMQGYCSLKGVLGSQVAIYCTKCSASQSLCREDHRELSHDDLIFAAKDLWNQRDELNRVLGSPSLRVAGERNTEIIKLRSILKLKDEVLGLIAKDFAKSNMSQGNYSEGEYTQDYRTRSQRVNEALSISPSSHCKKSGD